MFPIERMNGEPIDSAYAETRSRWEPLYEATQMKGDGEAHPALSPEDEFADYGTWDKGDIAGLKPKEDWMLQYEYARPPCRSALQQEQKLGVNPYKFGMIVAPMRIRRLPQPGRRITGARHRLWNRRPIAGSTL